MRRLAARDPMVTLDDVRSYALGLPRTTEAFVRGRVKFRIGRIVYLAFPRDETQMGFAFPKEWREALVESEPDKFLMPCESDLRYNWVEVRLAAIDEAEMRDLVLEAWQLVVPMYLAIAYDELTKSDLAAPQTPHEKPGTDDFRAAVAHGPQTT